MRPLRRISCCGSLSGAAARVTGFRPGLAASLITPRRQVETMTAAKVCDGEEVRIGSTRQDDDDDAHPCGAVSSSTTSVLGSPSSMVTVHFDLRELPPSLCEEFDEEANRFALRHLMQRAARERGGEAKHEQQQHQRIVSPFSQFKEKEAVVDEGSAMAKTTVTVEAGEDSEAPAVPHRATNDSSLQTASTYSLAAPPSSPPLSTDSTEVGAIVTLRVRSNWAQLVRWRCARCQYNWSARPQDRLDPQLSGRYGCPRCQQAALTASPHQPSRSSTSVPSIRTGLPTFDDKGATASAKTPLVRGQSASDTNRPPAGSLVQQYPNLAAQWDLERNSLHQNRVPYRLREVPTSASCRVWWVCSLCRTPWCESVSGRVARVERWKQLHFRHSTREVPCGEVVALCPGCEARGAQDRLNPVKTARTAKTRRGSKTNEPKATPSVVRVLADDPLLMSEVCLRPQQDPHTIELTSPSVLSWHCRYCGYDYQASVANRHLRHERCPQCAGQVRTPLNLLVIQRPDVVHEVSRTISRTALSYVTVQDEKEITFVCRTCQSPYRMTARARCAVPVGGVACPKCFLALSNTVRTAVHDGHPSTPHAPLSVRQRRRIKAKAKGLSRGSVSKERLLVTNNELRKRDHSLRN